MMWLLSLLLWLRRLEVSQIPVLVNIAMIRAMQTTDLDDGSIGLIRLVSEKKFSSLICSFEILSFDVPMPMIGPLCLETPGWL